MNLVIPFPLNLSPTGLMPLMQDAAETCRSSNPSRLCGKAIDLGRFVPSLELNCINTIAYGFWFSDIHHRIFDSSLRAHGPAGGSMNGCTIL